MYFSDYAKSFSFKIAKALCIFVLPVNVQLRFLHQQIIAANLHNHQTLSNGVNKQSPSFPQNLTSSNIVQNLQPISSYARTKTLKVHRKYLYNIWQFQLLEQWPYSFARLYTLRERCH